MKNEEKRGEGEMEWHDVSSFCNYFFVRFVAYNVAFLFFFLCVCGCTTSSHLTDPFVSFRPCFFSFFFLFFFSLFFVDVLAYIFPFKMLFRLSKKSQKNA